MSELLRRFILSGAVLTMTSGRSASLRRALAGDGAHGRPRDERDLVWSAGSGELRCAAALVIGRTMAPTASIWGAYGALWVIPLSRFRVPPSLRDRGVTRAISLIRNRGNGSPARERQTAPARPPEGAAGGGWPSRPPRPPRPTLRARCRRLGRGPRSRSRPARYAVNPSTSIRGNWTFFAMPSPRGSGRRGLSVARKNGKSGVIAAVLLAHLAGPLNRPEWRGIVTSMTGELAKELETCNRAYRGNGRAPDPGLQERRPRGGSWG